MAGMPDARCRRQWHLVLHKVQVVIQVGRTKVSPYRQCIAIAHKVATHLDIAVLMFLWVWHLVACWQNGVVFSAEGWGIFDLLR